VNVNQVEFHSSQVRAPLIPEKRDERWKGDRTSPCEDHEGFEVAGEVRRERLSGRCRGEDY
jgi:hypothetical protein